MLVLHAQTTANSASKAPAQALAWGFQDPRPEPEPYSGRVPKPGLARPKSGLAWLGPGFEAGPSTSLTPRKESYLCHMQTLVLYR